MATGAVLVENRPDIAQVAGILSARERYQRDSNQAGRERDQAHSPILRRGAFPENRCPAGISFRRCRWLRTGSWARSVRVILRGFCRLDWKLWTGNRVHRHPFFFGTVSYGAPVPDEPRKSVWPLGKVRSRPFARSAPSFDWYPSTMTSMPARTPCLVKRPPSSVLGVRAS